MGIKSIFDGLYVDQLFQKDERGRTVFYPHGLMGRGYRLPADREARVRRSMRRLLLVALVLGISFGLLVLRIMHTPGEVPPAIWLLGGGAFVLLLGLVAFLQARLALGLEPVSGPRPSVGEWLRAGRRVRAIELAPQYVDLAIARWRMLHPDLPVTLAGDGREYDAVAAERAETLADAA